VRPRTVLPARAEAERPPQLLRAVLPGCRGRRELFPPHAAAQLRALGVAYPRRLPLRRQGLPDVDASRGAARTRQTPPDRFAGARPCRRGFQTLQGVDRAIARRGEAEGSPVPVSTVVQMLRPQ